MKRFNSLFSIIILPMLFNSVTPNISVAQDRPKASDISVTWELLSIQRKELDKSRVSFTLVNNSSEIFKNHGWAIYFNQMAGAVIPESLPADIIVENIIGEFHRLYPTENFKILHPGESASFTYEVEELIVRKSQAPVGLYIVFDGDSSPEIISDYNAKAINPASLGNLNTPTPESRYQENSKLTKLSFDQVPKLLPRPVKISPNIGKLSLSGPVTISFQSGLEAEAQYLLEFLESIYSNDVHIRDTVELGPDIIQLKLQNIQVNNTTSESYKLSIANNGVEIVGSDAAGVFWGIQSFIALLPIEAFKEALPAITLDFIDIEDAPRFPYRGLHLDVSRNYYSKQSVKKLLDLMCFYKLNKFHIHLTDDEGWRLEIDGLPELTEVGAKRGHTVNEKQRLYPAYGSGPLSDTTVSYGTGYYSREDFIEILKYATFRHIEVIPEIDVPGHARAAIKSMNARYEKYSAQDEPEKARELLLNDFDDQSEYTSIQNYNDNVICVCLESTYNFLEIVVKDIVAMYKAAGASLTTIHCGGDEVPKGAWEKSPVCQVFLQNHPEIGSIDNLQIYFIKRFAAILARHNIEVAGWEEIALRKESHGISETLIPNPEFVDSGFKVYAWNAVWGWGGEDLAYRLANIGYPVIMCNASNLYFDLAYNPDPEEIGQNWAGYVDTRKPFELTPLDIIKTATIDMYGNPLDIKTLMLEKVPLSEEGKKNFLGIQGQLWSESIRGPKLLEYMIYPKLLGLAERAWAPTPRWATIEDRETRFKALEDDWNVFVNMLGQRELPRLEYLFGGVNYRIPLPGAMMEDGLLKANVRFPGLTIRYSTDGSEPDLNSTEYTGPVNVGDQVKLKTFSKNGRSSRTSKINR